MHRAAAACRSCARTKSGVHFQRRRRRGPVASAALEGAGVRLLARPRVDRRHHSVDGNTNTKVKLSCPRNQVIGNMIRCLALSRIFFGYQIGPITYVIHLILNPELLLERERRHERARAEALRAEDLRERRRLIRQRLRAVVAHAVAIGVEAGQDRAVRRQGQRSGRGRVDEEDAALREAVDRRRAGRSRAVAADPVGAAGVDRDQDESRRGPLAARGERSGGRREREACRGSRDAMHGAEKLDPAACAVNGAALTGERNGS